MNLREFFKLSTLWGKIFGAFFGYLMAGPVGAVFGVLIGNFFDRGFAIHYANPNLSYLMEKRKAVQKIFFEATFLIMGHIAKSDGRVTENEIQIAKAMMNDLQLNKQQKTKAKELFNLGKEPRFNTISVLQELRTTCLDNRDLLYLFVDIQYRAAQVDGLSTPKIKALNGVLTKLGFAPLQHQYRFQEDFEFNPFEHEQPKSHAPKSTLDHAFALLEIEPNASKQEVKHAYRRLMSRNHPDKLTAQGLPPEMIKLATDKTQKILKAYQMICQAKGW